MLPLWSVYALTASLTITSLPLIQEKFKANAYALTFWVKVCTALLITPYIIQTGLPTAWQFYFFTALTCVLYAVSDIIYFKAVPVVGSGVVTRILPASVIVTFFIWFAVDPALIDTYTSEPWKMAAILGIMVLFVCCATFVKKCPVSWQGVKLIWFVLFAASVGPIITKLALIHTTQQQGAPSYIFVQGLITTTMLGIVYSFKKPVSKQEFFSRHSIQTSFIIGFLAVITTFFKISAIQLVDNPGFVSMILFTDALWVILIYKIIGRKEESNIWAGLGIVACAALIVLVKSV